MYRYSVLSNNQLLFKIQLWKSFWVETSVPTKSIFFKQIGNLLEQVEISFGKIVNTALENLKFGTLKYWIGTKFREHKRLFRALGTIV